MSAEETGSMAVLGASAHDGWTIVATFAALDPPNAIGHVCGDLHHLATAMRHDTLAEAAVNQRRSGCGRTCAGA